MPVDEARGTKRSSLRLQLPWIKLPFTNMTYKPEINLGTILQLVIMIVSVGVLYGDISAKQQTAMMEITSMREDLKNIRAEYVRSDVAAVQSSLLTQRFEATEVRLERIEKKIDAIR